MPNGPSSRVIGPVRNLAKQPRQWDAITKHAKNYGLNISLFFTFYEGEKHNLEQLLAKEAFKDGHIAFVFSIKQTKKSLASWTTQ
jgi:hypothetical protein